MRPHKPNTPNNHLSDYDIKEDWASILHNFIALHNTLLAVYDLNFEKFVFFNDAISGFLGCEPKDLRDKGIDCWLSTMHSADRKKYERLFFERSTHDLNVHKNPRHTFNYRVRHTGGQWIYVLHEQRLIKRDHLFVFNIIIDITEKKKIDDFFDYLNIDLGCTQDRNSRSGNLIEEISEREHEVLRLIADGLSSREIAAQLFISSHTAITHRKNLIEKFKVKNTAELIKEASKVVWFA